MSGNYRDESSAAMAANEALRQENDELKAKLAEAERQQQAMQSMHQQQLVLAQQGYPPVVSQTANRARNVTLIVALSGVVLVCAATGVAAFLLTSRAPPPPPPVVYTPQPAPTGLRPDGLPYNAPPGVEQPQQQALPAPNPR
ncbi:MAG: hypothetical protein U0269_33385 [Polyangiales bacterium]